jgi:hypothetical protein
MIPNNPIQIIEKEKLNVPWNIINQTEFSHIFAIDKNIRKELNPGMLVCAFNQAGFCVGATKVPENFLNFALTIYGDDLTTAKVDGMLESEPITFKLYDPNKNKEFLLKCSFDPALPNSYFYKTNGLSKITQIENVTDIANPYNFNNLKIYPNPAHDKLFINFGINVPKYTMIKIFDFRGQLVLNNELVEEISNIDISSFSSGVYFIEICNFLEVHHSKLVIN